MLLDDDDDDDDDDATWWCNRGERPYPQWMLEGDRMDHWTSGTDMMLMMMKYNEVLWWYYDFDDDVDNMSLEYCYGLIMMRTPVSVVFSVNAQGR